MAKGTLMKWRYQQLRMTPMLAVTKFVIAVNFSNSLAFNHSSYLCLITYFTNLYLSLFLLKKTRVSPPAFGVPALQLQKGE